MSAKSRRINGELCALRSSCARFIRNPSTGNYVTFLAICGIGFPGLFRCFCKTGCSIIHFQPRQIVAGGIEHNSGSFAAFDVRSGAPTVPDTPPDGLSRPFQLLELPKSNAASNVRTTSGQRATLSARSSSGIYTSVHYTPSRPHYQRGIEQLLRVAGSRSCTERPLTVDLTSDGFPADRSLQAHFWAGGQSAGFFPGGDEECSHGWSNGGVIAGGAIPEGSEKHW